MKNSRTPIETPNYSLNAKLLINSNDAGDLETDDRESSSPDRLLGSRSSKRNFS